VVQHALNHTPSPKCNGRAPITAHTQLPPGNALSAYRTEEGVEAIPPSLLKQWRESHWQELAAARDALHRDVAAVATAKRAKERDRRNAQPKARAIQLDVGDYVLVGSVLRRRSKLQIRWLGPRRVVQAITDWIFMVEDLTDSKQSTHHVSRLKLFAAKDLLVTQDLQVHVAYIEGGRIVEELRQDERDVNQLAESLGVSHARVSQHLALLRAHHVVVDRRAGRHVHYRLAHQGLAAWLLGGLDWIAAEAGQAEGVLAAVEATRMLWGG
jgi:DNA-binding transcriptional ArsR family regulator